MAHRVILEIDQHEIRALAARVSGNRAQVTHATRISLAADQSWESIADLCARELSKHHMGRGEADIIVNRRMVEMREIKVPPAPDEELPDLLRYVAKNEFAAVTDQWRLDFVPLTDDVTASRTVIAAALSPQWKANIDLLCARCGLKLKRILLRPFLDTLIVAEQDQLNEGVNLLVHRVGDTIDLTVTQRGRVLLSRSVLLAGQEEAELNREAAQEIRRTMLTAPRIGEGRQVDRILVIGPDNHLAKIREWLGEAGDGEWLACDPLASSRVPIGSELSRLERREQFAAHLGALQSLTGSRVPQIDFANPRRRPEKKIDKRRVVAYAALAVIVILGAAIVLWQMFTSQRRAIAQLQKEFNDLRQQNQGDNIRPGVDAVIGEVQLVDEWFTGKVNWIAQLREISNRLLSPDQTIVESFTGMILKDNELKISISGQLDSRESGFQIQDLLREPPFQIIPGKLAEDSKIPDYPYSYSADVTAKLSEFDVVQAINAQILEAAKGWRKERDSEASDASSSAATQSTSPMGGQ